MYWFRIAMLAILAMLAFGAMQAFSHRAAVQVQNQQPAPHGLEQSSQQPLK